METDSVDYPDLLQVPVCGAGSNSNSTGKGRKHPFLQRSDSTLCLGCPPIDPFDTAMSEALPLADQPHLLQPHSRREDLFGVPRQSPVSSTNGSNQNTLEGLPTRLGLSTRSVDNQNAVAVPTFSQIIQGPSSNTMSENRRNSVQASEPGSSKYSVIINISFYSFVYLLSSIYKIKITANFSLQDKPKILNPSGDGQPSIVTEQIDRAPIIVSPNSQGEVTTGKDKDICKNGRSVIVRAGTISVNFRTIIQF